MTRWLIILALSACGSADPPTPSQLQTCKAACSRQKACNSAVTDANVEACQQMCDASQTQYDADDETLRSDCANADVILRAVYDCYQQNCDLNQAQACAQNAASSCVTK